jgi:HAD superfamily hydrolase (TIGR01509 family)
MKLLIFDLDGTLVDCKKLHQDGFRWAVTQQVPNIEYTDEEVEGLPTTEKIKYLQNKGYPITEAVDQLKREHTRAHVHEHVKFNSELYDIFEKLYTKYKICLASNSRSEFVFKCMNILKLWQFECVYSRDYGLPKPNPWMYNECMRIANSDRNNTFIFEDSPVGIAGAESTGANVIPINNSAHLISTLKEMFDV